jgi:hypothetical protein
MGRKKVYSTEEARVRKRASAARYRVAHREKLRAEGRRYAARRQILDPEKVRAIRRESATRIRAADPEKVRVKKRAQKTRWRAQDLENARKVERRRKKLPEPTRPCPDNCESCGRHAAFEKRAFSLDHDHCTGAFRGWLCRRCNLALGLLGDSVEGIEKAAAYLRCA